MTLFDHTDPFHYLIATMLIAWGVMIFFAPFFWFGTWNRAKEMEIRSRIMLDLALALAPDDGLPEDLLKKKHGITGGSWDKYYVGSRPFTSLDEAVHFAKTGEVMPGTNQADYSGI